jgi:hypothetical protein
LSVLISHSVGPGCQDLASARLAQRYSLYDAIGRCFGEICRLTSSLHAGYANAISAHAEPVAWRPSDEQQRHRVMRVVAPR